MGRYRGIGKSLVVAMVFTVIAAIASVAALTTPTTNAALAQDPPSDLDGRWQINDQFPAEIISNQVHLLTDLGCFKAGETVIELQPSSANGGEAVGISYNEDCSREAVGEGTYELDGSGNRLNVCLRVPDDFDNAGQSTCIVLERLVITIAYFNGINTSRTRAMGSEDALAHLLGKQTKRGTPTDYTTLYNPTGGILEDLHESFQQRIAEGYQEPTTLDAIKKAGGTVAVLLQYLWNGNFSLYSNEVADQLAPLQDVALEVAASWLDETTTSAAARLVGCDFAVRGSNTAARYGEHESELTTRLERGERLVFVAHSQGNLFANEAYRRLSAKGYADSMRLVHVAPPTIQLNGHHVLSDEDLIIAAIPGSVPPVTHDIAIANMKEVTVDVHGHGFVDIYLNPYLPLREAIEALALDAIEQLEAQ